MQDERGPLEELKAGMKSILGAFRPVMSIEQGTGRVAQTGTAFVVAEESRLFIVTAEHVLNGPEAKLLGVSEAGSIRLPRRFSRLEAVSSEHPHADVAWMTLEASSLAEPFDSTIPFALASSPVSITHGATYVAVGQPASKSSVQQAQTILSSKIMMAFLEPASSTVVDALGLDEKIQLAFTYPADTSEKIRSGAVPPARPRGMSGGAIVATTRIRRRDGSTRMIPLLVGVLTQFHESQQAFVATRLEHVWATRRFGNWAEQPLYREAVGSFDDIH